MHGAAAAAVLTACVRVWQADTCGGMDDVGAMRIDDFWLYTAKSAAPSPCS
jgi:hypothetical protein